MEHTNGDINATETTLMVNVTSTTAIPMNSTQNQVEKEGHEEGNEERSQSGKAVRINHVEGVNAI